METQQFETLKWVKIALINFVVLALVGVILRYKINFPLPLIDQKFLLHGHSHFAFVGWVTIALMSLMVDYLSRQNISVNFKRYRVTLIANMVTAYAMLFTFMVQGYAFLSITFSTLSIFVSYFFIYQYWQDLKKVNDRSYARVWFKTALILWAVSSIGAFTLAYLMATHIKVQDYFFAAIYFFLHFQYNGWFVFTCLGLLCSVKTNYSPTLQKINKKLFLILIITVIPTYLLSILWLRVPTYLYWIGTISGVLQLAAILYLISIFKFMKNSGLYTFSKTTQYLWLLALSCFVLKIILQGLSTIPYLSSLAFGFRPIVIAYLHLCFLGVISFFIVGFFNQIMPDQQKLNLTGAKLFISGVLLQELILMIQGLEMTGVNLLSHSNIILFLIAIMICVGLGQIAFNIRTEKPVKKNLL
ncbi:hypothetical protein [Pedobacter sp. JCM 36344]|uniref:hypothetical protein n=1 Tax=Pedobacter sp. JCM 36344 TaxID=3374280 RepID=UPI00397AAABA